MGIGHRTKIVDMIHSVVIVASCWVGRRSAFRAIAVEMPACNEESAVGQERVASAKEVIVEDDGHADGRRDFLVWLISSHVVFINRLKRILIVVTMAHAVDVACVAIIVSSVSVVGMVTPN